MSEKYHKGLATGSARKSSVNNSETSLSVFLSHSSPNFLAIQKSVTGFYTQTHPEFNTQPLIVPMTSVLNVVFFAKTSSSGSYGSTHVRHTAVPLLSPIGNLE